MVRSLLERQVPIVPTVSLGAGFGHSFFAFDQSSRSRSSGHPRRPVQFDQASHRATGLEVLLLLLRQDDVRMAPVLADCYFLITFLTVFRGKILLIADGVPKLFDPAQPGWRFSNRDLCLDRHPGRDQAQVFIRSIEKDLDRDTLNNFDEIAGRIFRR